VDVTILSTAEETARAVARRVGDALRQRPPLVLGLPAGRTPLGAYAELRRMHDRSEADFSQASAFLVDEFAGIARTDPSSFRNFLGTHLFDGVNLPVSRIHSLDGGAADLDEECLRYERELGGAGGVHLQLLGIGRNGHIGFNEPGDSVTARTHRVTLLDHTRADNAERFGGDVSRVPREALTIGIGTILSAEVVVIIALGAAKAQPVEQMIRGPVTTHLPASFLQLHRRVEVYLDRDAAVRL
jgi:glucosamine-6-phosphate deaminase